MSDFVDVYQQKAQASLWQATPWLEQLQTKAWHDFNRLGFPTRKHEEWKYTALNKFLSAPFTYNKQHTAFAAHSVPFSTGHLPEGVIVEPLMSAIQKHADKIKPYLNQLLSTTHGFHALNMACLHTGYFVYIPASVCVNEPIVLNYWQEEENQAAYIRHLIIAEPRSQATIIEVYQGADDCRYFTNTMSEVYLSEQAKLTHYKLQCESKAAYHIGHMAVQQAAASECNSHSISLGGSLVRSDFSFELQEDNARCLMNGIYMPKGDQHMDHHTTVHHIAPNCTSKQDYKGVLSDRARGVFNGKVVVAQHAQHTQAAQQNKNLLLSAQAEIDTKPQLEIFADDVSCSHGATVGQLDEDALFYLVTRGIGEAMAKKYLIQAFTSENLRLIPHSDIATWVTSLLDQQ